MRHATDGPAPCELGKAHRISSSYRVGPSVARLLPLYYTAPLTFVFTYVTLMEFYVDSNVDIDILKDDIVDDLERPVKVMFDEPVTQDDRHSLSF